MATISNAISLQDKMTPVFSRINKAMNSSLALFGRLNVSSSKGISSNGFNKTKRSIDSANNSLVKFQSNISKTKQVTPKAGTSSPKSAPKEEKADSGGGFQAPDISALTGMVQKGAQFATTAATYLDSMSTMQSRVSMINDGMQTTNELQDKILASANRSRASYQATADAVTKLNMLAGDQFKSNDEAISFVETLNKMFTISGTSGEEATSAMTQLTQAMSAGKLQGDEFTSMMENAPMLANAIAKSMGKSKAELKKLSSEGAITSDVIKKAMTEASSGVEEQFSKMPMTFGQSMQVLKNNFMNAMEPIAARFSQFLNSPAGTALFDGITKGLQVVSAIGTFVMEAIGTGINFLQQNLQTLMPYIQAVGVAMLIAGVIAAGAWLIAQWPLLMLIGICIIIANIFNLLGINILSVVGFVIEVFKVLGSIIYQLLPIILAVGAAALLFFLIPLLMALPAAIADLLIMAAIWLMMNWPILLVAAGIVLLIYILSSLGVSAADVVGFVVGLFYGLLAVISNIGIGIANAFIGVTTCIYNTFNSVVGTVKELFYGMAVYIIDKVRGIAEVLQGLVNLIPGVEVNIVGDLDRVKSGLEAAKEEAKKQQEPKEAKYYDYKNVKDAYNKGFDKGHGSMDKLGSGAGSFGSGFKNMFKMPEMPKDFGNDKGMGLNKPSGKNFGGGVPAGLGKPSKISSNPGDGMLKGGKLDKVGKIDSDVKITDEDIKMLKDISKAELINKYTTLKPNMQVQFTGPVTETADINKIIAAIEDMTEEALSNTLVEGA
ncbi:tape measure protein [Clostridium chrysemydis]|uniref:tape measure protein n=1 Tax=Clostridium chrysemydis TaxID=2665504 RepID=UPI0018848F7C|nr:tape measure protein [Clostridium chrysemydis]